MASFRPGIDIVVVDYKSPEDLTKFLFSVLKYPPSVPWGLHVALVEPGEADLNVVRTFEDESYFKGRMKSTVFATNVGYAKAVNTLARSCPRETLGFFNADTRFRENVLNECHNVLCSNEQWGVLGPRQVDDEGRVTAAGIFGTNERPQDRAFHHPNSEEYGDIRDDAVSVSGSAYFVKGSVWKELADCPIYRKSFPASHGAFLPTPLYYEEMFCSVHARDHGYKVTYYGPATMVHRWSKAPRPPGSNGLRIEMSRQIYRRACDEHGISHE